MSDQQDITQQQFLDMVDRFINLANDVGKSLPRSKVSAALLFAAARYNAFNWANRDVLLEQTLDEAVIAFRTEYENMFRDNAHELTVAHAKG
jgi:hypothetical protein